MKHIKQIKHVLKEGPGATTQPPSVKTISINEEGHNNDTEQYQNGTDVNESETDSSTT